VRQSENQPNVLRSLQCRAAHGRPLAHEWLPVGCNVTRVQAAQSTVQLLNGGESRNANPARAKARVGAGVLTESRSGRSPRRCRGSLARELLARAPAGQLLALGDPSGVQDPVWESVQDPVWESVQESVQESVWESVRDPVRQPGGKTAGAQIRRGFGDFQMHPRPARAGDLDAQAPRNLSREALPIGRWRTFSAVSSHVSADVHGGL
jgi:hypothetical protein